MNYTPFGTRCNVQKLYFQWPISELNFGLDMRVTIACGGDRYFFLARIYIYILVLLQQQSQQPTTPNH